MFLIKLCLCMYNTNFHLLNLSSFRVSVKQFLIYSRTKVETFQCAYDLDRDSWTAYFNGHFHSVFTNNGNHFPGTLKI